MVEIQVLTVSPQAVVLDHLLVLAKMAVTVVLARAAAVLHLQRAAHQIQAAQAATVLTVECSMIAAVVVVAVRLLTAQMLQPAQ